MKKNNQTEVCEQVVRFMMKRKDESLTIIDTPDERERSKKAVDLHVRGDKTDYCVEHTQIESFDRQIYDAKRFIEFLSPLEKSLAGKLPRGEFVLCVTVGSVAGVKDSDKILNALEKWILEMAPVLSEEAFRRWQYIRYHEKPANVPFEVVLCCGPNLIDGFYIARLSPKELEQKRCERIETALNDKCPKLATAKKQHNARSVLVLESNDNSLTDQSDIAEAFAKVAKKRVDDIPDEVYLVETEIPYQWTIWVLKEGHQYFPDINEYGPHYIDRFFLLDKSEFGPGIKKTVLSHKSWVTL